MYRINNISRKKSKFQIDFLLLLLVVPTCLKILGLHWLWLVCCHLKYSFRDSVEIFTDRDQDTRGTTAKAVVNWVGAPQTRRGTLASLNLHSHILSLQQPTRVWSRFTDFHTGFCRFDELELAFLELNLWPTTSLMQTFGHRGCHVLPPINICLFIIADIYWPFTYVHKMGEPQII